MTIFLRPQPAATPVDYHKMVGKVGLVVMPQRNLAIYTCKSGPNKGDTGPQGPQGEPGVDQNSWFDTIIASASDEETPLIIGGIKTTFRSPYPLDLTLGYIRASLSTAPTGAPIIIDVYMNGVTMFDTPIQIDIGSRTSVGSAIPAVLAIVTIPDDAEFTVYVTQVGSAQPGAGLKVAVTGIKTV